MADVPPSAGPVALSVLICTRDRVNALRTLSIGALQASLPADCEVIVADHGSSDGTAEFVDGISARDSRFRRIFLGKDQSFGALRNAAADAARADVVVYLDDDAIPDAGWAGQIIGRFASDPELVGLSGPIRTGDTDVIENPRWAKGANMMFRRDVLRFYRFDPLLWYRRSIYWDEVDLLTRMDADKLPIAYHDGASVRHYPGDRPQSDTALQGIVLNAIYSHCKIVGGASHYRELVIGIVLLALHPTRSGMQSVIGASQWGVKSTRWRGPLAVKLGWKIQGAKGAARAIWELLVDIPVTAARQRRIEAAGARGWREFRAARRAEPVEQGTARR